MYNPYCKYRLFWINFSHFANKSFQSVEEAVLYAKSHCFEAAVHDEDGMTVAYWTPLGGTCYVT